MSQLTALPHGSLVLVTGSNGYIGSHVVNSLLQQGIRVRGTVRSAKPWLDDFFGDKYGKDAYESVVVTDLEDEEALSRALDGVSGVAHIASDLSWSDDPNRVIPSVVKTTETMLAAAARYPSVKRFVLTSSSAAALTPVVNKTGVRVDENTWNETAVKCAWDPDAKVRDKGYFVYSASKTEGERAAWRWVKENKPGFVFNTVLPDWTIGEILHPEIRGSTMSWVRALLGGDQKLFEPFIPQYYVDVVDVARLHVIALLGEKVQSERIFAFAAEKNRSDVCNMLQELRPDNKLIPAGDPNEGRDLSEVLPAARAKKLLQEYYGQDDWVSFRDSIAAGIRDL